MLAERASEHAERPWRFDGPNIDLLFAVIPLLRVLRGEKRAFMHRAFVRAAQGFGSSAMHVDEGRLPVNQKEAVLALHRAVIDLAMRHGLSRRDLVENFNEHAEGASFGAGSVGEAAERALALLAMFHAHRLLEPQQ